MLYSDKLRDGKDMGSGYHGPCDGTDLSGIFIENSLGPFSTMPRQTCRNAIDSNWGLVAVYFTRHSPGGADEPQSRQSAILGYEPRLLSCTS
jgi:hypothetical protein